MSENLFGLTVATDKGLDDLQCQRLLSENRSADAQDYFINRCLSKKCKQRLGAYYELFRQVNNTRNASARDD